MTRKVIVKDVQAKVADIEHDVAHRIGRPLGRLRARLRHLETRISDLEQRISDLEQREIEESECAADLGGLAELAKEAGAVAWIEDDDGVIGWVMPDGTRKPVRGPGEGWLRDRCNACGMERWVYRDSGKCVQCEQREASA